MRIKQYITAFVCCLTLCGSFAFSVNVAVAQPAPTINYQGKLTNSSGVAVANGTYNIRFWLLQSTSQATTSAIWTESLTGANQVQVTNGLFSVMLGSTSPLTSVNFNQPLFLGVEIGGAGAAAWDGEMLPRKPLGTVPAAFEAYKLGGVASSSFLRSDEADQMIANTLSGTPVLTIQQTRGVSPGDVLSLLNSSASKLFTVTASGNVGIGTTTMDRMINVAGASNAGARFTDTTNHVRMDVRSEDFQGFMGTFSNHDLRLITNNTSRLTITSDGKVGIGTTGPTGRTEINDTGAVNDRLLYLNSSSGLPNGQSGPFYGLYADIVSNNSATASYGAYILSESPGAGPSYGLYASTTQISSTKDSIGVYGNATVNSAATNHRSNRAIGSGPVAGVYASADVFGTSMVAQTTALHAKNNSQYGAEAYGAWIETTAGPTTVVPLKVVHSDSELFRITSTGNVGIGNTNPGGKLEITSTAENHLRIGYSAGSYTNIFRPNDTGGLVLAPQGTEVFRVTAAGNVGVGTTSPYAKLSVSGSLALTGGIYDNSATRGSNGQILQTTGTGVQWVATSSLGIDGSDDDLTDNSIEELSDVAAMTKNYGDLFYWNGSAWADIATSSLGLGNGTFLGLSDTPGSFTSNAIPYVSGSALAFDSAFVYDGTNLGLGTGSPGAMLDIFGTNNSLRISYDISNYSELTVDSSGVLSITSTGGAGSGYTIGSGLTEDTFTLFDGNALDFYLGLDDTDDVFKIGTGSTVGSNAIAAFTTATSTFNNALFATSTSANTAFSVKQSGSGDIVNILDGSTEVFSIIDGGNVGIGTSSPNSRLSIQNTGFSGAGVVGTDQYLQTANSIDSVVQYGNRFYLNASNTATTTVVGSMFRIKDDTTFSNTVRGLEVQANKGVNTKGENTALSGFARTFGVRGYTSADAGASFEPAGGFFETGGTTQGNAVRGYSSTITTATLLSLFQDSSTFSGTGLEMNFGNTTGSFSSTTSKYLDFQNAGASVFTVSAFGTTTIGDGTTNNMAGLQIGYGGICVDNDGACTASTTGRITAVETQTGNSDLAEMYFSSTKLKPGEVVTLAGGLSIDRATKGSKTPVLGVVSTKPGLTLGFDDESLNQGETGYPLALSGRVPVILSTENGPIKRGDQLMLSSLPGVAMKATSTGVTIGIALEDFDETRQYSDTYINQFGDDMVEPVYEPIFTNTDPRINDGCYYSGGRATGDEPCVPLNATTTTGRIDEANERAAADSVEEQLDDLRNESSDTKYLADGAVVSVGRVVMFVDRGYRWIDDSQLASLGTLFGTSSITNIGTNKKETVFDRVVRLANNFVDGVLSVFTLKANRVETNELCVDGVCVTADDLRTILNEGNQTAAPAASSDTGQGIETPTPTPTPNPTPEPTPAATTTPVATTTTSTTTVSSSNPTITAASSTSTPSSTPNPTQTPAPTPAPTPTEPKASTTPAVAPTPSPTTAPTPTATPAATPTPTSTPTPDPAPTPTSTTEPSPTSPAPAESGGG